MSQQSILREYLVALGYRVNTNEERRANVSLAGMDRRVLGLGKGAVAAAAAVVSVTTAVARSWERLFYSSRLAGTTVEGLQAIEFGARNAGMEAGRMTGILKNFAMAMRSNPALKGFLEGKFGIQVEGRNSDDVFLDFAAKLKEMPPFIAEGYAAMFGMDREAVFLVTEYLEKLKAAAATRKRMNEEAGLDAEKAAAAEAKYMEMWREAAARAGVLGQTLQIAVLPYVEDLVRESNNLLIKWTEIVKKMGEGGREDFLKRMREGLTGKAEGERVGDVFTPETRARLGMSEKEGPGARGADPEVLGTKLETARLMGLYDRWKMWREGRGRNRFAPRVATDHAAVDAVQDLDAFKSGGTGGAFPRPDWARGPEAYDKWAGRAGAGGAAGLFAGLEQKYGLPKGLLDRVWKKESGRGANMFNPKSGAQGHFQFIPATQKEYGLKNPYDLGESADAAARKYRDLLKEFGGDLELAAAAYNWGQGKMREYGLGAMPKETRDYVKDVAGGLTVTQDVDIHVHGVNDPQEAARAVAREQQQVGASVIRNFQPRVR